jgi:hypothetical protein
MIARTMRRRRQGVKVGAAPSTAAARRGMQRSVSRRQRITIPDPVADRPRPLGAAVLALCALCAGAASAYGARGLFANAPEPPPVHGTRAAKGEAGAPRPGVRANVESDADAHDADAASDAGSVAPSALAEPMIAVPTIAKPAFAKPAFAKPAFAKPAIAEPAIAEPAIAEPAVAEPITAPESAIAAEPSTVTPVPSTSLRFFQRNVAYLQCAGLRQRKGPFPCPRDRDLEQQAWEALSALEHCELAQQPGRSEVRFDFGPGTRAWTATGTLERGTVVRCVGAALARVATSLHPARMIVAFRFELR